MNLCKYGFCISIDGLYNKTENSKVDESENDGKKTKKKKSVRRTKKISHKAIERVRWKINFMHQIILITPELIYLFFR